MSVHFTSLLASSGQKIHSTRDNKRPYKFTFSNKTIITCWEEILAQMSVGSNIQFKCPASSVFGGVGLWNSKENKMSNLQY